MIYQNIMNKVGRRSALPGIAGELDALKSDLSSLMVANKGIVNTAVGPPAGSKRISDAEAARGLDTTYSGDSPEVAERLKLLTIGQLVKLTQDTIRLRKSHPTQAKDSVPEGFTPPPVQPSIPSAPPVPPAPDLATPAPTPPMPTPMPMPMPMPMSTPMPEPQATQAPLAPLAPPAGPPVQVSEPLINILSQQSGGTPAF